MKKEFDWKSLAAFASAIMIVGTFITIRFTDIQDAKNYTDAKFNNLDAKLEEIRKTTVTIQLDVAQIKTQINSRSKFSRSDNYQEFSPISSCLVSSIDLDSLFLKGAD